MALNFLILLFVIGLVILFAWLTRRAWMVSNPYLKWTGTIVGGLFTLITLFVGALGLIGMFEYYNPPSAPVREIDVAITPGRYARGQHLAVAFCVGCHSPSKDFPMSGGVDVGKELPINLGSYVSVNLTPAGPLKDWTDGEIFRALRDNVDKDGNRLVLMASTNIRYISDQDLLALVAFLRSQQPVESETPLPPDRPNFLALILTGANIIPERELVTEPILSPPMRATAEYGEFMTSFMECKRCHGADLSGGTSPIGPQGPSLRLVKQWTEEEFIITLRTGVNPNGRELSPLMPWQSTGRLDNMELSALYQYLVSLPD